MNKEKAACRKQKMSCKSIYNERITINIKALNFILF